MQKFLEAQHAGDFNTAFNNYALPEFTWIVGSAKNDNLKAFSDFIALFRFKEGKISGGQFYELSMLLLQENRYL